MTYIYIYMHPFSSSVLEALLFWSGSVSRIPNEPRVDHCLLSRAIWEVFIPGSTSSENRILVGGFNTSENISQIGSFPQVGVENIKCLKPPPRIVMTLQNTRKEGAIFTEFLGVANLKQVGLQQKRWNQPSFSRDPMGSLNLRMVSWNLNTKVSEVMNDAPIIIREYDSWVQGYDDVCVHTMPSQVQK